MATERQCFDIEEQPRAMGDVGGGSQLSAGGSGGGAGLCGALAAEAAGTALLVAVGCLPAAAGAGLLHQALAAGVLVAMLVQCFDHISFAMFNPTVSLAGALMGKLSWPRAALYCCCQVGGATVGAALLAALPPLTTDAHGACVLCVTSPGAGVGAGAACAVEGALGACLALTNCAAWDPRAARYKDSWPLRIGATVAALSLAAGGVTGASMNPARSLGPALCAARWTHHWVYWVGPLGGSAGASLLYRALWALPATARPGQ